MTEELKGMPPRSRIAELIDQYAEETQDINDRREIRRQTKAEIISIMREMKKGEISVNKDNLRYTFKIIPGDADLRITISHKNKEE